MQGKRIVLLLFHIWVEFEWPRCIGNALRAIRIIVPALRCGIKWKEVQRVRHLMATTVDATQLISRAGDCVLILFLGLPIQSRSLAGRSQCSIHGLAFCIACQSLNSLEE